MKRAAFALGAFGMLAGCGPGIDRHAAALASPDPAARIGAARALAEAGPAAAAALPALVDALADPLVVDFAIWALGEIGPEAAVAVPALLRVPVDALPLRHAVLCVALGKVGAGMPDAAAGLERGLESPHAIVRQAARGAQRRLRGG